MIIQFNEKYLSSKRGRFVKIIKTLECGEVTHAVIKDENGNYFTVFEIFLTSEGRISWIYEKKHPDEKSALKALSEQQQKNMAKAVKKRTKTY